MTDQVKAIAQACVKSCEGMKPGRKRDIAAYTFMLGAEAGAVVIGDKAQQNPFTGLRFVAGVRGYAIVAEWAAKA